MRFQIKDDPESIFDDYEEAIDYCIDEEYHREDDYFEEWVNECYGSIEICGVTYSAFEIIDTFDDGNYHDVLYNYCDSENENDRDNARYELVHAHVGDEIYVQNQTIVVIDDELEEVDDETFGESLEELRARLNSENNDMQEKLATEKLEEDNLMQMFLNIGG